MAEQTLTLAGGCFWGMQDLLRRQPGVLGTRVGYTGGETANPVYEQVKTGRTGHAEAIEIRFDDEITGLKRLFEIFFQIHDPTTVDRQGNDIGSQYRSAIFFANEDQKRVAQAIIRAVDASGLWPGQVATSLEPLGPFWEAEGYHQDYLERIPDGYTCHFLRPDWKLPDDVLEGV